MAKWCLLRGRHRYLGGTGHLPQTATGSATAEIAVSDLLLYPDEVGIYTWAQLGGGHGDVSLFSDSRDIVCHVPATFLSLGFVM